MNQMTTLLYLLMSVCTSREQQFGRRELLKQQCKRYWWSWFMWKNFAWYVGRKLCCLC